MFTSNVFNRARSPASQVDYEAQSRQSDVRSVRSQSPRENRVISNNQRPQSPYVNGKKAADYVAPHLSSNVVFYDHSYGYVNDMPNDRLLSPVQNDRFNRKKQVTYAEPQAQTPPKEKNNEPVRNQSAIQPRRLGSGDYEKEQYTKIGERRGSNRQEMTSPRNEETNKRAAGVSTRKNEEGNVRDDRSEASTIVSNLSSTAYLCPKCFNRHLGGDRKTQCMIERERDIANERKIASYNQRLQEDEDARRNKERARRVNEGKEIHDKLNQEYEAKLDYRRSPKKSEGGTTLSKIFENEEELRFRQSELGSFFRSTLKDQMRRNEYDREMEKFNNSKPYDTSLRVGEGYRNKYIESPQSVLATLKDQVEERAYLQAREKDLDRKEAQDRISYAQRQQEEVNKIMIIIVLTLNKGRQKKQRKELQHEKRIKRHLLQKSTRKTS